MKISMLVSDDNDKTLIQNQLSYTSSLLNPLIEAFAMEGNYHMFTPCYKAKPGENCTFGSPWTQIALGIMASPNASVQTNNEFRPVQNLPPHLPFIFNNCTVPFSCTLNISTVTDNIYDTISETMDAALTPVAATEMRSNFKIQFYYKILYILFLSFKINSLTKTKSTQPPRRNSLNSLVHA